MPGVGTLIDMSGIIAGGATALAFGRLFSEQMKNMMMTVCGISVFVIGITGIMQGMLTVSGGAVSVNGSIPLLISLVTGTVIGELLGIEKRIANLGGLMQKQFSRGEGGNFADGFVKASMVVGVGAMAVMGPITEGLSHRRGAGIFDYDRIHHDSVPWDQSDLEQGDPCREYAADGRDRCGVIL